MSGVAFKFYYDLLSPPSRALITFFRVANIPVEPIAVALRKGEHLTEKYNKEVSRFPKLPCINDDGFRLSESVAIVRYVKKTRGFDDFWYPEDAQAQALVDEYLEWTHTNIRISSGLYFFTLWRNPLMTGEKPDEAEVRKLEAQLNNTLDIMENTWLKCNSYIAGEQFTIADVFAACDIEQPSEYIIIYDRQIMEQSSGGRVKFLDEHMENYNIEHSALHRKLQSKVEALKIMRKELERFRTERDQFKLMAETLQIRYTAIKKSLNSGESGTVEFTERSSVAAIVNDLRERNTALTTELESLRQSLSEKEGDIRVLRERKCRVCEKCQNGSHSGQEDSPRAEWNEEKSQFIAQLEDLKKKNAQLKYDFRSLLDEKEEVVTERDAFKCKVHRLNHELSVALKGNESQIKVLDIDSLVRENKYLQERLKNVENELELVQHSLNKYKIVN
uniref:Putative glutathione s-transferase theta-1 n=1 Tax=Lutzomyia longipalpis TaxID=7200 RepID=A0A1B0CEB2_LUTLO